MLHGVNLVCRSPTARILHSPILSFADVQFGIGSMSTPLIVTHPCTLLHEGLRHTLRQSTFRPVRILSAFSDAAETEIRSAQGCVWLMGVEKYNSTTNELVRRVVATCAGVKAVILPPNSDRMTYSPLCNQELADFSVRIFPASGLSSLWN